MATGRLPDPNSSPLTAKGDLYTYSTVPAKLAVGNNGETLVADSSTSTGLRWQGNFAAGKNKIINGDCTINQRAFTTTTTNGTYGIDRFFLRASDGTSTYSVQSFTAGSAPVAGYEATQFVRLDSTGQTATSALTALSQRIEDVRTFANQTITVSFWAKASSGTPNIAIWVDQNFGTGGSATVNTGTTKQAINTSWTRYSFNISVPSISGKTIGTASNLAVNFGTSAGSDRNAYTNSLGIQTATIDLWGFQAESGSVATAFQTATGTLAGELAACQRYYQLLASGASKALGIANTYATTAFDGYVHLPVEMRTTPTLSVVSGTNYYQTYGTTGVNFNDFSLGGNTSNRVVVLNKTGLSGFTAGGAGLMSTQNASSFVAVQAEL